MIGALMLQNASTNAEINIDTPSSLLSLLPQSQRALAGLTFGSVNIVAQINTNTYSVPANPDAVIPFNNIVQRRADTTLVSAGTGNETVYRAPVGLLYDKFVFYFIDSNGDIVGDSVLNGVELIVNQSFVQYKYDASTLATLNQKNYGVALPVGVFALDFMDCGENVAISSSRNYIDSSDLAELWIKVYTTSGSALTMVVVSESIGQAG